MEIIELHLNLEKLWKTQLGDDWIERNVSENSFHLIIWMWVDKYENFLVKRVEKKQKVNFSATLKSGDLQLCSWVWEATEISKNSSKIPNKTYSYMFKSVCGLALFIFDYIIFYFDDITNKKKKTSRRRRTKKRHTSEFLYKIFICRLSESSRVSKKNIDIIVESYTWWWEKWKKNLQKHHRWIFFFLVWTRHTLFLQLNTHGNHLKLASCDTANFYISFCS